LRDLLSEKKARRAAGCFVVEGEVLVRAAVDAGLSVVEEFVREGDSPVALPDGSTSVHVLDSATFERVATTVSPQAHIAVVAFPAAGDLSRIESGWILVADRVQDPGNLGTMIRSAAAAGATALVVTPGTVDIFSPKVVRAAAGALFVLPCIEISSLDELAAASLSIIGTSSHDRDGSVVYDEFDFSGRVALVMGNEAVGLDASAPIDSWVTIPHVGPVESLNVAMATTVLSFEIARQRKLRSSSGSGH
jgi:TrmH family RNA methyltransferase